MNEVLFAVLIDSERKYRRAMVLARYKAETKLALYIVNNRLEHCIHTQEMANLVAEVIHDPDFYQEEIDSIPDVNLKALDNAVYANMKLLISNLVPMALWRRELDLPLTDLEKIAICGEIPGIHTHPSYHVAEHYVTIVANRLFFEKCRQCSKKAKFKCGDCDWLVFCSRKCLKKDLQDNLLGHRKLECLAFQETKRQSPR